MTRYAKLINDKLEFAPVSSTIVMNDRQIYNPTKETYLQNGYKVLVYSDKPEFSETQKLQEVYTEKDTEIVITYIIKDMTEEELSKFKEEQQAIIKQNTLNIINQAKDYVEKEYQNALNMQYPYKEYYIKPMFLEKYSKAYVSLLDDIDAGINEQVINVSIYKDINTLVNLDLTFDEFKNIYRAVKEKALLIEKQYQVLLAKLTELLVLQEDELNQKVLEIYNTHIRI